MNKYSLNWGYNNLFRDGESYRYSWGGLRCRNLRMDYAFQCDFIRDSETSAFFDSVFIQGFSSSEMLGTTSAITMYLVDSYMKLSTYLKANLAVS